MTLSALHTDLYELTMLAGYFDKGMHEQPATFDLFFREPPFGGGFAVFAGLQPALDYLQDLKFTEDDMSYLRSLSIFNEPFLQFLQSFSFNGRVTAPPEGTIVFPHEPLLTIEGTLAESQFVETALLNIINFQTLGATKAARITLAAGEGEVIEFGLRRAQGPDGGLSLARAAAIGGVRSTSNVLAGKLFDLPVKGTHAHSWIMSFDDELTAFRAYAEVFPDSCILLVDTYDTIKSGLPNALIVASELRNKGHELTGIRLDSGDIAELSITARRMFDEAGFSNVKIVASNELDEERIVAIRETGGRVDIYGVGTRLATCAGEGGGALGGVYKLVSLNSQPRLKTTSDPGKGTLPGAKHVWRLVAKNRQFLTDVISLADEKVSIDDFSPEVTGQEGNYHFINIRDEVMKNGKQTSDRESLACLANRTHTQLQQLPDQYKSFQIKKSYPVQVTKQLSELQTKLAKEYKAAS